MDRRQRICCLQGVTREPAFRRHNVSVYPEQFPLARQGDTLKAVYRKHHASWFNITLIVVLCLVVNLFCVNGQSLYLESTLYQGMPAAACIRYLRSGGGVGCQAKPSTTGILYLVSDQSDVARFASTAPTAGYAVVMPYGLFLPDNIEALQKSGKLAAIILVKNGLNFDRPDQWSPDSTCPNCQYGLYGNQSEETWHLWNPNGNSLFFGKYEFPIFGVSTDSTNPQRIDPLVSAVNANKLRDYSSYPLYAVEFDAFMYAAVDSETCLRRGECEPVGGLSVWSTFSHNYLENNVDAKKPVVVVSSKLDGRAFIHDWGPLSSSPIYSVGAHSPKTGLVTALAVAEALSKYFREPGAVPLAKDILFTFFDAESWAFAGSQRFVNDISTPMTCKEREAPTTSCPTSDAGCSNPCFYDLDFQAIKLENIDSIFEFDTVGGIGTTRPAFYMHVDAKNAETDALVNLLNGTVVAPVINGSTAESLDLVPAFQTGVNARLPPSSAMAFLAKRSIPAVVISDYQNEFSNRYYNSEFDDETTWDTSTISRMCALANKTAQAVYQRASGNQKVPASIAADCHQISLLMRCFTRSLSCQLLANFYPTLSQLKVRQDTTLAGHFNWNVGILSYLVSRMMTNMTATDRGGVCSVDTDCQTNYACLTFETLTNGTIVGQCVKGFVRFHWAYGTGIQMNYGKRMFEVLDSTKGTWTQSKYRNYKTSDRGVRMRLFQVVSRRYEGMQLGIGLAVTLLTICATVGLKMYSERRFKTD